VIASFCQAYPEIEVEIAASEELCVIAVGLVDLRLQHRLHVPRLHTDHW